MSGEAAAELFVGIDVAKARLDVGVYPGGESWRQAVDRVGRVLPDLQSRWEGERVLIIGHVATRWALDHLIDGRSLEELCGEEFGWREGWEYSVP